MPIEIGKIKAVPYRKEDRSKNQLKIADVLKRDPMMAWTIKELQAEAEIKYPAATLVAVNALEKKGLVEKFQNEEDKTTYVHWIGNSDRRVLVTKEKQYDISEDEIE